MPTPTARPLPRPVGAIVLGLGYLALALLGHALTLDERAHVASFWPAAGLYAAALMRTPPSRWLLPMLAVTLANAVSDGWMQHVPWGLVVAFVVANAAEAMAAAALVTWLRRRARRPFSLDRFTDVLAFGTAALLGPALGASLATAGLLLADPATTGWLAWRSWWAADLLGIVLVAPLVLLVADRASRWSAPRRWPSIRSVAERVAILAAVAIASLVFWLPPPVPALSFVPILPLVWAALRTGPSGAVLGTTLLAALAVGGTLAGRGLYAEPELAAVDRAALLQVYLAVVALFTLGFAALGAGLKRALARQQAAHAALTRANHRLDLALDAADLGTWTWYPRDDRLVWDARQHALMNVPPDEVPAPTGAWFLDRVIHPDDRDGLEHALRRALSSRDGRLKHEFRVPLPGGTDRWLCSHGRVERDGQGRVLCLAGLSEDITERRVVQSLLEELNSTLQIQVHDALEARNQARRQAMHGERLAVLGQLAGGIAHDFNNVLQTAQLGATMIENQAVQDHDTARRFARMILKATTRGAAITRRLLAFARQDAAHTEAVDPAASLEDLQSLLSHTLGAGITVRVDAAAGLPPVRVEKAQLDTVLINLATNARDAMPTGGQLVLAARLDTVPDGGPHPAGLEPGRYIRWSVSDTGTGMDAATLARVIEPFFTTKPVGQGTGLGLSMAKSFAEESGGAFAIDSAPGTGTTVHLWLPALDTVPLRHGTDSSGWPGRHAARVLLVDDEPLVRTALAEQLGRHGFDVRTAADGQEALAILIDAEPPVELLITDLSMPGLDGRALIARARDARPGLPAILLTGFTGAGPVDPVTLDGSAVVLLRKPVIGTRLVEEAVALLRRHDDRTKTT